MENRTPLPISNKKLWEMAVLITKKQKAAREISSEGVDWDMLEGDWFDWLEECLFGEQD